MAKFGLNNAENYGGKGGAGFFRLKGRNTAHIRFLYSDITDVEGYAVHEIDLYGKKRYVDCLRGEHDTADKCPLCSVGNWAQVKYLVPVYDEDADEVLTWDRGKAFGRRLEKLFAKYATEGPLCGTCFTVTKEINHEGVPYYTFEPDYNDGATLYELPEYRTTVYGNLVLVKTAEEMEEYLEYGDFGDEEAC
ncbi:MAG: hypothetical protein MJ098_08415 [Saccharofermentans sp.]|nr:hypothetical protein [Saccharofermentans sp.]